MRKDSTEDIALSFLSKEISFYFTIEQESTNLRKTN